MNATIDTEPPALLLQTARAALAGELALPPTRVSRAAALFARTALEHLMDEHVTRLNPDLTACSARVRLICWETLIDPDQGARATWAFNRLSQACHHHAYELAPNPAEVEHLIDLVAALMPDPVPAGNTSAPDDRPSGGDQGLLD